MKKLVLIRHAKSSWEHDVIDHERPLNKRGTKDASIIAEALKAMQLDVNCVVISDATRTKLTAQIILKTLKTPQNKVSFSHKLYDFLEAVF
jgi:phosphohistidine phosphatase